MIGFKQFIILIEGKIDDLKAANPEHADVIDHLASIDHTPTKKYVQPLTRMHVTGNLPDPYENRDKISDTLKHFDAHGPKLDQKDFGQYKDFDSIKSALEPHVQSSMEKKKKKEAVRADAPIIHQDDEITVRRIDSEPAACTHGKGTQWCVSATGGKITNKNSPYFGENGTIVKETPTHFHMKFDGENKPQIMPRDDVQKLNMFDRYSENGANKLFMIQNNKTGEKHAFHEGEGGNIARDAEDEEIKTKDLVDMYPQLTKIEELRQSNGFRHFITPEEKEDALDLDNDELLKKYGDKMHPVIQAQIAKYPKDHDKLMDIMGDKINPYTLRDIAEYDGTDHNKLIDRYGQNLHPIVQKSIANNPDSDNKLLDALGNKLHPWAQTAIARSRAGKHEKLLDVMGDKLDPDAQYNIADRSKPKLHEKLLDIFGDKLHTDAEFAMAESNPNIHNRLMDVMGDKLDPNTQRSISSYTENHEKLLDTMGDKLSPSAQTSMILNSKVRDKLLKTFGQNLSKQAQESMATRSQLHDALLDTIGDKIHPWAQEVMAAENPDIHEKMLDVIGNKLSNNAQGRIYSVTKRLRNRLLDTVGKNMSPVLQDIMADRKDQHGKLIDTMGDDLHPTVQLKIALIDSDHHEKLIDTMGDKLDRYAQGVLATSKPHLHNKLEQVLGDRLDPKVRRIIMNYRDANEDNPEERGRDRPY